MNEQKRAAINYVMQTLSFAAFNNAASVEQFVTGVDGVGGSTFSASEIRRALGWLYGRGGARVVRVENGQEFWSLTKEKERVVR